MVNYKSNNGLKIIINKQVKWSMSRLYTICKIKPIRFHCFQCLHPISFSFFRSSPSVLSINVTDTSFRTPLWPSAWMGRGGGRHIVFMCYHENNVPFDYYHNDFVATYALGHITYGYTWLVPMNQRMFIKLSKEYKISDHKWSMAHRVLKSHRSKMSILTYMLSW